jgi:hypothetical protein
MHHLETLIQAIPPAVFAAGGAIPLGQPTLDGTTSPITPFMYPAGTPSGVPPPSLHVFPLTNPSTHFTHEPNIDENHHSPRHPFSSLLGSLYPHAHHPDQATDGSSRMSLTSSYLYFDDEGYTRWQGETSGLPVLDLLVERHTPPSNREHHTPHRDDTQNGSSIPTAANPDWFPDRQPRRTDVNPQTLWRFITSYIVPELMDRFGFLIFTLGSGYLIPALSLVQCYLSTSYYILPFLHVPTFLAVRIPSHSLPLP